MKNIEEKYKDMLEDGKNLLAESGEILQNSIEKTKLPTKANRVKQQKKVDVERNKIIDTLLSAKERNQHKYVEKVLEDFRKKEIPVIFFAQLPFVNKTTGEKEANLIQYNNIGALYGHHPATLENELENLKNQRNTHIFNRSLFYQFVYTFSGINSYLFNMKKGEIFESATVDELLSRFVYSLKNIFNGMFYRYKDSVLEEIDEKIKKLEDEKK